MKYIGTDRPIHDAVGKVTGHTRYAADLTPPGTAHLAMVYSSIPHGNVTDIDARAALALDGVYGVYHCLNTPDYTFNRYRSQYSQELPLEEHVFHRYVRFIGDRIGVVAARDAETARRAASLVRVSYDPLPHAITFDEGLEGKNCLDGESPIKSSCFLEAGQRVDEEGAVTVSAHTFLHRLHHAAMEPHVVVADYDYTLDELTISCPNQSVFGIRTVVADMLHMPYSRVRVTKTTMGGSFGAKQEWFLEPVAAVMARTLRRPVKLVLDRGEVMRSAYCRAAMDGTMTGVFRPDGTLLRLHLDLVSDAGAYMGNAADYVRTMFGKLFRCYRTPYASMDLRVISTNTPVSGAYRGWSSPECALMLEHLLENAARTLNMDPLQLRLKNVLLPGESDVKSGLPIEQVRTRESLLLGARSFDWEARRRADEEFNAGSHRYRRGTAVACGGHGNTYFPRHNDFAGAELRMAEDGTVQANISVHDHGCGTVTAFKMILAETLCVPPIDIRLDESDTARSPFDLGCYASRSTFVIGRAAQRCGEKLRRELLKIAAQMLDTSEDRLYYDRAVIRCRDRDEITLTYKDISWWSLTNLRREIFVEERYHNTTNPGVTGTHFAHVEVDTWTGLTRVLDYLAVHDVGQAINPAMCVAQIQGAAQMGCGAALREELTVSPDGRCVTSLAKYHLMNAPDLPDIRVELIQDGLSNEGPYGAKSVGEVSYVPAAPAVAAAVNQALKSDLTVIPMTPDRIMEYISKEGC